MMDQTNGEYVYKGYQAKFEADPVSERIFASVANSPDIFNMTDALTVAGAKAAFCEMIDEYLTACVAEGWTVSEPRVLVIA